MKLKNKVIIYTGAGGLIGTAAAKALCDHGALLVAVDISADSLAELSGYFKAKGCEGNIFCKSDMPSEINADYIDGVLNNVIKKWGKIDCLINSAYPRTSDWHKKFEDIPYNSWQKNIDMHLNGYFLWSQRTALKMMNQKYGNIINFSSIYGIVGPHFGVYNQLDNMTMPAAYSAIKGAISNFTKYLASYLGPHNIRVNAICPGGVLNAQDPRFVSAYCEQTPLGRMATPDDVVGPLLFLASDLSVYITGVNLPVDGGWTAI